jgi:hypothetical protein
MSELVAPFEENTEAGDLSNPTLRRQDHQEPAGWRNLATIERRPALGLGLLFELVFRYRAIAASAWPCKAGPEQVMPIAAVDCVN